MLNRIVTFVRQVRHVVDQAPSHPTAAYLLSRTKLCKVGSAVLALNLYRRSTNALQPAMGRNRSYLRRYRQQSCYSTRNSSHFFLFNVVSRSKNRVFVSVSYTAF